MRYEINVSENGRHLFATAERNLTNEWEALKLRDRLQAAFPHANVNLYRIETTSTEIG